MHAEKVMMSTWVAEERPKHGRIPPPILQRIGNGLIRMSRLLEGVTAMGKLQIELPPEISEGEARLLLAFKLYELGRLSLGQAARLAGYSKRAFMELLGRYGVPVIAYPPEEL
jgi:Uncharacterized small protein